MTLHAIPLKFLIYEENFILFFNHCIVFLEKLGHDPFTVMPASLKGTTAFILLTVLTL
jgi:hypothetical protein